MTQISMYLYIYKPIFPCSSVDKEFACNTGDPDSILGSRRSPGEGNGNPLQYFGLENPTEEPGGLQSMGSQRVRHDLGTKQQAQSVFRPYLCLFHLHPTSLQESLRAPSLSAQGGFKLYQLLPTRRNPHLGASFYPPTTAYLSPFPHLLKAIFTAA